jgi:integrase
MSSRALLPKTPKYVRRVRAKGHVYYYFNTGKLVDGKLVWAKLPDMAAPEFWNTYASMQGHRNRRSASVLTIPKLIDLYQKSDPYRDLAASSRYNYDIYLRRLAELLPSAPAALVTRKDMRVLRAKMADTPGAANLFIGTCGGLFKWAASEELIQTSPTNGITPLKMGEHEPWPEPVLNAALVAEDTRVRLLVHLLYYTALRLNDALSLTWNHIQGDYIVVQPQKGRRRKQELSIRLHKALREELARHPKAGITIAVNPATKRRYGEKVARDLLQAFAAGLGADIVPHGLRKNAVNSLLEAGNSVAETASVSGQTLQLVEHYAKQRNQAKLSDAAVLRWEKAGENK